MWERTLAGITLWAAVMPTVSAQSNFGGTEPTFEEVLVGGPWYWGSEDDRKFWREALGPHLSKLAHNWETAYQEAEKIKGVSFFVTYRFGKDGSFQKLNIHRVTSEDRLGREEVADIGHFWRGSYKLTNRRISDEERNKMFDPKSRYRNFDGNVYFIDISFTDREGHKGTMRFALNEAESDKYYLEFRLADATGEFWDTYSQLKSDSRPYNVAFGMKNK